MDQVTNISSDYMGNIKTSFVKRIGKSLYEKNKEVIKGLIDIKSKKMRNIVAGYVTSLKRQEGR